MTPLGRAQASALGYVLFISVLLNGGLAMGEESKCYGTTSNGYLEGGVKLPANGSNFTPYSSLARMIGRTYVHSSVLSTVVEAYERTAESLPETVFVYGETGFKNGGEFRPHKTHRNGLSVDFMVPIRNKEGKSIPLPTSVLNRWGYDVEFDDVGSTADFSIDYDAIAEHLYQLHKAALRNDIEIWRVIFDPELQPMLASTKRWQYLESNLEFSKRRSWVRHDDHYHVDFEVACDPIP